MTQCNEDKCKTVSMNCKNGVCKIVKNSNINNNENKCKTVSMNCMNGVCKIVKNSNININSKKPKNESKNLNKNNVHIVSFKGCKGCKKLEKLLKRKKIPFTVHKTIPQVFIKGVHIGGSIY